MKVAISIIDSITVIAFAGNLKPSYKGKCTMIYWLFSILQRLFNEAFIIIFEMRLAEIALVAVT